MAKHNAKRGLAMLCINGGMRISMCVERTCAAFVQRMRELGASNAGAISSARRISNGTISRLSVRAVA